MADPGDPQLSEDGWADFRQTLADKVKTAGSPRPDLMSRRLRSLADITGISATDIRILEILLLYHTLLDADPDQRGNALLSVDAEG